MIRSFPSEKAQLSGPALTDTWYRATGTIVKDEEDLCALHIFLLGGASMFEVWLGAITKDNANASDRTTRSCRYPEEYPLQLPVHISTCKNLSACYIAPILNSNL